MLTIDGPQRSWKTRNEEVHLSHLSLFQKVQNSQNKPKTFSLCFNVWFCFYHRVTRSLKAGVWCTASGTPTRQRRSSRVRSSSIRSGSARIGTSGARLGSATFRSAAAYAAASGRSWRTSSWRLWPWSWSERANGPLLQRSSPKCKRYRSCTRWTGCTFDSPTATRCRRNRTETLLYKLSNGSEPHQPGHPAALQQQHHL